MKRLHIIPMLLVLFAISGFSMADKFADSAYKPVFMTRDGLEKSISYVDGKREMVDPGKIYIKGTNIYVNEKYKGIHIIDNSNPKIPVQTGYIVAPGCIDMAIKNDVIYIDNAVDFVAYNMVKKEVTTRIKNYFPPHTVSPDGRRHSNVPADMIIVGWSKN